MALSAPASAPGPPSGFDAITLNHWLWFKYKCHEETPAEFQRLFENIVKRARPEFVAIRAYGKIGDRKCDGLFAAESTIFQVYAPDEWRQAELEAKVEEDFSGALVHWPTMTTWVFVYNVRRGLPPDVARLLLAKRKSHPTIEFDQWSNDRLWEMTRGLSLQQRAEILGAPTGYEYLFFAPSTTTPEINRILARSWFVIIQDAMSPVNLAAVTEALAPDQPFGAPVYVRPVLGSPPWLEAARYQQSIVHEAVERARDVLPRFAVFSFAQIPLAIHLGFVLSDRIQVRCFQHDRDRLSWTWPSGVQGDTTFEIRGIPTSAIDAEGDVVIRVSLSATVSIGDTRAILPKPMVEVDLMVAEPDVMWLRHPDQLRALATTFRNLLVRLRTLAPRARRIHLFYAGPTGGAVTIGQQINPRMNPPVELYQYSYQTTPRYTPALTLTEELA